MDGPWYVFIQLTLYAANHTKKSFLKLGGWLSAGEAEERDGIKWFLIWSCFSVWCRGKTRWRTSLVVELWLQHLHKEFWFKKDITFRWYLKKWDLLKFRYYEKATTFWKIYEYFEKSSTFFWDSLVTSIKENIFFFKFLWPSQNIWTLWHCF